MRREPSLTFDGALEILGQHEHKTIKKIDKLLGGVILGGGALTAAVAAGATPLAPLAPLGVVWGWIEQKGLAIDLLKSAVDAVSGKKMSGLRAYERRELIAAAHSTIVVASIFEAVRDHVGKEFYSQLKITDDEKRSLISQFIGERSLISKWVLPPRELTRRREQDLVGALYASEIPAPSATWGFEENAVRVGDWQVAFFLRLSAFIDGLAIAEKRNIDWSAVPGTAVERYRSRYLELAAKVREFSVWAEHGEHAATRTAVREVGTQVADGIEELDASLLNLNADVVAGFNANRDALNRVEALLSALARGTTDDGEAGTAGPRLGGLSGLLQAVSRANSGILDEPIIAADRERYPAGLEIPRVGEIYVNPRYRVAEFDDQARPADERWWKERASRDDFDVFLARHVTSPDATRRPLLLLGHPGAGKSLLTKVFAARLPTSEYTVVRVPLRRVSADAKIHHQIEEALDVGTHQRIAWSDLAGRSEDTVRVVLLDGLDELLQASEHDRSRYLEDVMDFQDEETRQHRPVVVVVTSRTVVADRVRVPDGTTIVKLDPFSEDDIADWLGRWKRVNSDAIAAGTMGELTMNAVQRQPELAEQPLLLLMLALYAADPELPALDEDMTSAELYRRLLDGFARREAGKNLGLGHDPSRDELEQRVRDHLDRLATAALGMFNRGRQGISEEELGKDLEVLEPRLMERSRPAETGQRIIGEFFFVHAPEARMVADQGAQRGQPRRAYEFLHATFGEYLVARRVMDELVDVAATAFSKRRGPTEPDDNLLFALLSHQVLAVRQSMLDFAREIFAGLDDTVRPQVLEMLEVLVSTYRNRHGSDRYAAYRPVPPDTVHQLACYSANLVALRLQLESASTAVPLTRLLRVSDNALEAWRGTPRLWKAGLDDDSLQAVLGCMTLDGDPPVLTGANLDDTFLRFGDIPLARLDGDPDLERRLRYGTAITDKYFYFRGNDSWVDVITSCLIPAIVGLSDTLMMMEPPDGAPDEDIVRVAELIFKYLRSTPYRSSHELVLQLLFKMPAVFKMDELALATAVFGHPELRDEVPELQNFEIYGRYAEIVRRGDLLPDHSVIVDWRDPPFETLAVFADILGNPLDLRKDGLSPASPGLRRAPGA